LVAWVFSLTSPVGKSKKISLQTVENISFGSIYLIILFYKNNAIGVKNIKSDIYKDITWCDYYLLPITGQINLK